MSQRKRTEIFVFKKDHIGEADLLFSAVSRDFGRMEILGRGIRKIGSKLRGSISLFSFSEIEFVQTRTHDLLVGGKILDSLDNMKYNIEKATFAFRFAKLLDEMLIWQENNTHIWNLIKDTTEHLSFLPPNKLELLYLYFFWKGISILGYKPELRHCIYCQRGISENTLAGFESGGVVCRGCRKKGENVKKLDSLTIKLINLMIECDIETIDRIRIENERLKKIVLFSQRFFRSLFAKNES